MAKKKASKKKASKKKAVQAEVLVVETGDAEQEPAAAPAHVAEPMCYSRGTRSQTKHMTVAEHQKLQKGK
jgi:hypothetical protein